MMRLAAIHAALAMLPGMAVAQDVPLGPAEAIRAVDASANGVKGSFRMHVLATGHSDRAVYLNSNLDYRTPDNVTFALSMPAAKILDKRYGAPVEDYLKGRDVVVTGTMRRIAVVNVFMGKVESFNRTSHQLWVQTADQVTVLP